jgi:CRP/FNR family cyclic AMP-dependent transcriptional regulator
VETAELARIPWLSLLEGGDAVRAREQLTSMALEVGDTLVHRGDEPTHWCGVVHGLLRVASRTAYRDASTIGGLPPGAWFGESALLKNEPHDCDVVALRKSRVAKLPVDTFHWLLDHCLPFNRYVMCQLNERLGQFITACEIDRTGNPDTRVARSLGALFDPLLYPTSAGFLRITQQELAALVGLSRQRVNKALRRLRAQGWIELEYSGLRVIDLARLQRGDVASNTM